MARPVLMLPAALLVLLLVGSADNSLANPNTADGEAKAPVDNWGSWWPKAQLQEGATIDDSAVAKARGEFETVAYGYTSTPWGRASASLSPHKIGEETKGLRFDLLWSGPGSRAPVEDWERRPQPKAGDVQATIVGPKEYNQRSANENPTILAWVGGGLGTSGNMMILFDWLPADFEDYWVRIDLLKERHWFLIPYGLGSDPFKNTAITGTRRGSPKKPSGAAEGDFAHNWNSVVYRLLRDPKPNNFCVTVSITNGEYAEVQLELYREGARWTLDTPRTSAAYLWPNGYTRFGSMFETRRDFNLRRWDRFRFWHHGHDDASFGLLRIGMEERVVDLCVPSSLMHARHGRIDE